MQILSITMTAIGLLLLLFSMKPASYLSHDPTQSNWRPLYLLIMSFIMGYSGFIYYLIYHYEFLFIHSVIATILLLGGLFVFIVIRVSLGNYNQMIKGTKQEKYNALHDSLTGLPNRTYFKTTLTDYIQRSEPFIVFSLNLNNFKQVNDALGHYYGDQLLVAIATNLTRELAPFCRIFRTRGDEFTLILKKSEQICHETLIATIHTAFLQPYQLKDYSIESSISIGAAVYPDDSSHIDRLLQYADVAMYASKKNRQKCVFYAPHLDKDARLQLEISGRLRKAIANKEFELHFQPILLAGKKRVHGAEVLIRWPQADGSFISPELFIGIAERSGLITQITEWVIEAAIQQLHMLNQQGFTGNLHINLSTKDLQSEALYQLLLNKLNKNEITADQLVLEITESTMMTDLDSAKRMMFKLAENGFAFSIDDFGTGFSSFSLLRTLPIHQIKIDRSFVQQMDSGKIDYAIVQSAIYLAKNLSCSVVAEGVENKSVEAALVSLQCDYVQGFYYSKPIPLAQFITDYCAPEHHNQTLLLTE